MLFDERLSLSALLLVFDYSSVNKICLLCKLLRKQSSRDWVNKFFILLRCHRNMTEILRNDLFKFNLIYIPLARVPDT